MKTKLLSFKDFCDKYDEDGNPLAQPGALVPWISITNLLFNEARRSKKKQDLTPDAPLTGTSTIQITQGGGVNYTEEEE